MAFTINTKFHSYYDASLHDFYATVTRKHFKIQERELSYRFYPHFHPYVAELVKRLIEGSVQGLQDTDTLYKTSGGAPLIHPGSVQVALAKDAKVSVPDGARVILVNDLAVTVAGVSNSLSGGMRVRLNGVASATLPDEVRVTLVDGTQLTGPPGESVSLSEDMLATLNSNTQMTLPAGAGFALPGGTNATLPADHSVVLLGGAEITAPKGASVKVLDSKPRPELFEEFFSDLYKPSDLVQRPYPVKDLDFTSSGAYAVYNWELFYHVPLTIGIHLSKNQRYEEAMRWFHYIFDPTDDSDGPTPERFWKVKPFQQTDVKKIEDILVNLSTRADTQVYKDTINSIGAWTKAPFRPHVVARHRQSAYMFKAVMAYLDNLIDWGDSLFRQDTGESIDEALMFYVMAANILGPRPQAVPKKGSVRPQTYANLKKDLKALGTVLVDLESDILFDLAPHPNEVASGSDRLVALDSIGKALYFCVPRNDKLLSYWDTVADRLFKIRNSLNIQGIFRQLALFEPPIDPALLARATAAGLDVGAVVSGLNQPLPLVRFQLLAQKAAEICQEVKSLGNNLLSAMEKEDNEALAILRAKHEGVVMEMVEHVKYGQLQEAIKSKEGLLKSLALAVQRYAYYERQLGKKPDEIEKAVPSFGELDKDEQGKVNFSVIEPFVVPREIEIDIAQDLGASGGKIVSSHEKKELGASHSARDWQVRASTIETAASLSHYIPNFSASLQPLGIGGVIEFGGSHVAPALSAIARYQQNLAAQDSYDAGHAGKMAGYQRREQDWAFQSNLAAGEITQIFKQLRAAQIREAIAELELNNHRQQMKHAEEIERFLTDEKTGKKTNQAFYTWMKREVKGLYGQVFQFAFDIAKKAERALQHELGNSELSYLQFGYLAGKEGLFAGEKLYLDIKRMEMAYHDLNQREYELTKHVSLLQVNPLGLLQLRTTGRCTVSLPEEVFDMDGPGHYFRRIKSVAVSIPCVAGPYTSVNCTLTLLKSFIRKNSLVGEDGYAQAGIEDSRFSAHFGSLQSIVTSSGQQDSGLFETNLRDERYLPFENSGVISEWQLELPAEVRQFDYDTISDVILHFRYTAREGGGLLRNGAAANLKARIDEAQAAGSVRLFSVRHEFPSEWARFKTGAQLSVEIREEHFPFWSRGRLQAIKRADLARKNKDGMALEIQKADGEVEVVTHKPNGDEEKITVDDLTKVSIPKSPNKFTLKFTSTIDDKSIDDLWLALTWGKEG